MEILPQEIEPGCGVGNGAVHDGHDRGSAIGDGPHQGLEVLVGIGVESAQVTARYLRPARKPAPDGKSGPGCRFIGDQGMIFALTHLEGEEIHARLRQDIRLFAKRLRKLVRLRPRGSAGRHPLAERTRHRDRMIGCLFAGLQGHGHRLPIDLGHLVAETRRCQHVAPRREGVRDDDIGTRSNVVRVNVPADLRVGEGGGSAPGASVHGHATRLQLGSHSPVQKHEIACRQHLRQPIRACCQTVQRPAAPFVVRRLTEAAFGANTPFVPRRRGQAAEHRNRGCACR